VREGLRVRNLSRAALSEGSPDRRAYGEARSKSIDRDGGWRGGDRPCRGRVHCAVSRRQSLQALDRRSDFPVARDGVRDPGQRRSAAASAPRTLGAGHSPGQRDARDPLSRGAPSLTAMDPVYCPPANLHRPARPPEAAGSARAAHRRLPAPRENELRFRSRRRSQLSRSEFGKEPRSQRPGGPVFRHFPGRE